jgi:hypothetical protein
MPALKPCNVLQALLLQVFRETLQIEASVAYVRFGQSNGRLMRRELLERGFGHIGKNKSALLPPQRKDASTLEIGERVNGLNPSVFAVLVQMLRMGTHCLVKEFHPKFHVEVIRRPYTCVFAQLVPYDVILLQHGWFVVEPRHFFEIAFTNSEIVLVSLLTILSSGSAFLPW